jgi:pimeloyl-ACP methyl ester carboxylesterase
MTLAPFLVDATPPVELRAVTHNDYSCRSAAHPNPVVLLHGLGATYYEDLNVLEAHLKDQGFCTFSLTYGGYPGFPFVGGLKAIKDSAQEIASFVRGVHDKTGAEKVDMIGHSEGAFQTLYVPKFGGVAPIVGKLVAVAPPTNGTTAGGLYNLAYVLGNISRGLASVVLHAVGCAACDDLGPDGAAVVKLNDGAPIVQPGNTLTVIASRHDELITPTTTSFVHEDGVANIYVQDVCPQDPVGHIGLAYDMNMWNLVINALQSTPDRKFVCSMGSPGR